jgi:hypothetical protein
MSNIKQNIPLTREEALQVQPNKWVFRIKQNARRAYPVHYFCNNEEGVHNRNAYTVCIYHRVWYQVKPDQETGEPVLGAPALEVHAYNQEDGIESSYDSTNKQEPDPVDTEIRHSPVTISPTQAVSPVMSTTTRMTPLVTMMMGWAATLPPVAGVTPASIQNRINAVLRCTGPPSSRGGPLGPESPGSPGSLGPGGPVGPQALQQPIVPAGDVKTMGQLPQTFMGNCAQVDNFIKEVKGYLQLNQDMAGFNLSIRKIVFMLTLIKGLDTMGWTHNMGNFLDMLGPADNIPDLWMQFLLEFGQQFQDMQKEDWAHMQLEGLRMHFPEVDTYITKFEELARQAGYTVQ